MNDDMPDDNKILKSLTVYPPHGPPITFAGNRVIAFDHRALAVKIAGSAGEEGEEQTLYLGLPFSTVSIERTVVPAGGIILPGRG
jgi:hypothetical protein